MTWARIAARTRPYPRKPRDGGREAHGTTVNWIADQTEAPATTQGEQFGLEVAASVMVFGHGLLGLKFTAAAESCIPRRLQAFQWSRASWAACYTWKAINARSIGVFTNRMSTDPYRGADVRGHASGRANRRPGRTGAGHGAGECDARTSSHPSAHQQLRARLRLGDTRSRWIAHGEHRLPRSASARRSCARRALHRHRFSTYVESAARPELRDRAAPACAVESSMVRVHPTGSVRSVGTHSHGRVTRRPSRRSLPNTRCPYDSVIARRHR